MDLTCGDVQQPVAAAKDPLLALLHGRKQEEWANDARARSPAYTLVGVMGGDEDYPSYDNSYTRKYHGAYTSAVSAKETGIRLSQTPLDVRKKKKWIVVEIADDGSVAAVRASAS